MKVILQENIKNLGKAGDIVSVKDGYARNYLIPQNLAIKATVSNIKVLEHQKNTISRLLQKKTKKMEDLSKMLENRSITVAKAVGKGDKLYGSVTARDIEEALREEDIFIERKQIIISEPIKTLGVYPVTIQLDSEKKVEIKVWVVAK